jgi:hypothetical protein
VVIKQNFGCEIFGCATEHVRELAQRKIRFGKTAVAESNVASSIKEDVLGLEIMVDDAILVQMFQCQNDSAMQNHARQR